MIEKTIMEYLQDRLDVPAFLEVPEEKPVRYVTVERTAGRREDHVYQSSVVVDVYDGTLAGTIELNEAVVGAMLGIIELDGITSCKLNSNYNDTDTATKEYRYGALFDLTHY